MVVQRGGDKGGLVTKFPMTALVWIGFSFDCLFQPCSVVEGFFRLDCWFLIGTNAPLWVLRVEGKEHLVHLVIINHVMSSFVDCCW